LDARSGKPLNQTTECQNLDCVLGLEWLEMNGID